MKRAAALLSAVLLPLLLGTGWAGEERRKLLRAVPDMTVTPVALDAGDPARRRLGALMYLGGAVLTSRDRAFGSFSALAVEGDRFLLVSDGGHVVRFRMGSDWRARDVRFAELPSGPRTGWEKRDRDAESLARDPATGRTWVGFESVNQIWRYGPGGTRMAAPAAMARWRSNGGAESLARLADGRFVALSESPPYGTAMRVGLVWAGDPTERPEPAFRFSYIPAPGYDPSDLTELPDGRLLVLERRLALPFTWSARLVVVERGAIRPDATVRGREIAMLAAPVLAENFEGVAVVRESGATMLWLVSDDNWLPIQRTLLLKFRLD
ncbi:esterase-like activity of phytase family protein [Sphingomonas sp. KR1UV-12]|uniref:Esterase-like activity of phytase family protein n=1 Tax=Sphingomonas aurea TaxID=3063994 RepID=A0ABT9EL76_9SPHN|nr:esterase-like activity of phytase family protein [Sphingomonas sp. KR1UV-12]MDP1027704.1 esterase-like activity of phytase family protein [Sphingomonas sp. KR1UV-12]